MMCCGNEFKKSLSVCLEKRLKICNLEYDEKKDGMIASRGRTLLPFRPPGTVYRNRLNDIITTNNFK